MFSSRLHFHMFPSSIISGTGALSKHLSLHMPQSLRATSCWGFLHLFQEQDLIRAAPLLGVKRVLALNGTLHVLLLLHHKFCAETIQETTRCVSSLRSVQQLAMGNKEKAAQRLLQLGQEVTQEAGRSKHFTSWKWSWWNKRLLVCLEASYVAGVS